MPRGVYPRKSKPKGQPREKRQAKNGNPPAFNPTVEDLDAIAPAAPPLRNGGNSRQPWGQPYEASASEFEKRDGHWERLYNDAMLRLEKTPASKVIVYPFETDHQADRAYEAVAKRARTRLGKGRVQMGIRRSPPRLFVQRGPNWKS